MHARRRSSSGGGGGFRSRSNSVGIGLASGRISPEGSIRGHGMYSSEYRNFNRGFGRGLPKPYPPPPQPPRKVDIFMEAGRLAAEYLVSQGSLPPSSLPGKWQNGNLKGCQMEDFQEFRVQDRENPMLSSQVRNSGFARVGNVVVPDGGSGRRRFPEDFNSLGNTNHMRGRRKMGPFQGFGSDWGRENGRKGSWSEKTKALPDMVEGGDDFVVASYQGELLSGLGMGGEASKVITNELPPKSKIPGDSESKLETYKFPNNVGSKASSFSTKNDLPPETDAHLSMGLGDANVLISETKEVNDGNFVSYKMERENTREDFEKKLCSVDDEPLGKHGGDLLRLCSFGKVPTKARSSLASRVSKRIDQGSSMSMEQRSACAIAPASGSKVFMEEDSVEASTHCSKSSTSDISRVHSVQSFGEAVDLDAAFVAERDRCTTSQSFTDMSSFMHQEDSSDGPPGFVRCESMVLPHEGDSSVHHVGTWEANKRPRESPSSAFSQVDDDFLLHNLRAKQTCSEFERLSPDEKMVELGDEKMLVEGGLVPNSGAESDIEAREEKQLLPSSFKICDLNLMDASETAESPVDLIQDHVSTAPSAPEVDKEAPMDVGLSISNNLSGFDDYHGLVSDDAKVATVADSANGSLTENKVFDTSGQKTETMYSSLENFLNQTENAVDLPDIQDGYGNAISQLLGTNISNCSSVPTDIDDLHAQISLHGQEGIPGDDDPIYLSLGEIPISFLGVWDQPTQDYGKPF